ncbi:hypothetical protein WR25_11751 [Diploscapter pachys]|uniref:C3H1-type domain-containing protein n=1 Tax=Diploscapter pachys TaxID=2018661 RepID=A0A2A2KPC1_9BILA|nr:hypothetical protein WR25_11751 [Diploscapter pachys]
MGLVATRQCVYFRTPQGCHFGARCRFAHGDQPPAILQHTGRGRGFVGRGRDFGFRGASYGRGAYVSGMRSGKQQIVDKWDEGLPLGGDQLGELQQSETMTPMETNAPPTASIGGLMTSPKEEQSPAGPNVADVDMESPASPT